MFFAARHAETDLGALLGTLPTQHQVFVLDGAWLVVGPTGVFVVASDPVLDTAVEIATAHAGVVRSALALELDWVPFVDALVIAELPVDLPHDVPATPVPHDLLWATIAEGPRTIDDDTLARLALLGLRRLH